MSVQHNDLHSNSVVRRVTSPVAIGTTGTGQVGKIIDRRGFGGLEFLIAYGAITATAAVFTVTVKEGDATGTMTSVADGNLIGTEALAGIAAGTPRTSGVNRNVVKSIGYRGNKRYVQCSVKSTTTAGTLVSVDALLFNPESSTGNAS
jgi:hypothetical protein